MTPTRSTTRAAKATTCTVTSPVAGGEHVVSAAADTTAPGLAGTGVGPAAESRAITVPRG